MFLGHFAVALAAKKAAPQASLGLYVLAAQWADALWPALLLTGTERVKIDPGNTAVTPLDFVHYPISHSLLTLAGWGVLFGAVVFLLSRNFVSGMVSGGLVVSHWFLDWFVHRPDLPLTPSREEKYGLGLWGSLPATLAVELLLLSLGVWVYLRTTRAQDRIGKWSLAGFVAVLALIYVGNLFGPPPPNPEAIAYLGLAGAILFVGWAAWIDRHRETVAANPH